MFAAESGKDSVFKDACNLWQKTKMGRMHSVSCMHLALFPYFKSAVSLFVNYLLCTQFFLLLKALLDQ